MKKGILVAGVATAIIVVIVASYYTNENDVTKSTSDIERKYGTVDTTMGSPVLGSLDAPITIIEFGDYQCPQCNKWYHDVKPDIEENYIQTGKANLVFVDLAFFGPDSKKAAQATYCAEEQGKYWEYHNMLYSNQGGINDGWANTENLKKFASGLNLDLESFNNCLDSDKYQKRVEHNIQVAKKNGASGTPTFIIVSTNGQQEKIEGAQPFSVFKQTLDSKI